MPRQCLQCLSLGRLGPKAQGPNRMPGCSSGVAPPTQSERRARCTGSALKNGHFSAQPLSLQSGLRCGHALVDDLRTFQSCIIPDAKHSPWQQQRRETTGLQPLAPCNPTEGTADGAHAGGRQSPVGDGPPEVRRHRPRGAVDEGRLRVEEPKNRPWRL